MVAEILVVFGISRLLPYLKNDGYMNWALNAGMTFILSCAICLPVNVVCYRKEFNNFKIIFGRIIKRKKGVE